MAIMRRARIRSVAAMVALTLPRAAQAHVKWFCGPIDASLPPLAVASVVTPLFLTCLAGFTVLVSAGGVLDALLARWLPHAASKLDRAAVASAIVLRTAVSAYAICLWLGLAVVPWADAGSTAILTPDLLVRSGRIGWLQLAIALFVLVPRLSLGAAAGVMLLYLGGVGRFGPFYMIDYLFFPALAAYLALADPWLKARRPALARRRAAVLTLGISVSLMWTAVEKFLFPQWTIQVLLLHPRVAGGFALPTVATVAGFVEFTLAFYLLVGREILVRLAALLLMAVFMVAMPTFGMLDVVGHIPLLAILLVVVLDGETDLQRAIRRGGDGVLTSGVRVGGGYLVALFGLTALYYALHALSVAFTSGS